MREINAPLDSWPARNTDRRLLYPQQPSGCEPVTIAARTRPQSRDRLHLSELQPDRRPDGLRERGAAAFLPRPEAAGAEETRHRRARARRNGASVKTSS